MVDRAMPREITDDEGVTWSCIQAFAGRGNDPEKTDAARVNGSNQLRVVCTPSGGAASVRLELPDGWEAGMPDAALLQGIRKQLRADQARFRVVPPDGGEPHFTLSQVAWIVNRSQGWYERGAAQRRGVLKPRELSRVGADGS